MNAVRPVADHPVCAYRPVLADLIALGGPARAAAVRHAGASSAWNPGAGSVLRHIVAPGRGVEFAGSRAYQPGDDPRAMDWRQTARRGRPFVKEFHPERERRLLVLVDQSAGMAFGTRQLFKSVAAAHAAAVLAWAVTGVGERVGGVVWHGDGYAARRPEGRDAGVLGWLHLLTADLPSADLVAGDLAMALDALARMQRPQDRCVVLADHAALADAAAVMAAPLHRLGRRGHLLLVPVFDPLEATPPPPGRYPVQDDGPAVVVDYGDPAVRQAHVTRFQQREAALAGLARQCRAALWRWPSDAAPLSALAMLADFERTGWLPGASR